MPKPKRVRMHPWTWIIPADRDEVVVAITALVLVGGFVAGCALVWTKLR